MIQRRAELKDKVSGTDVTSRALEWLFSEDTGVSSKTLAAVMLNVPAAAIDYPGVPVDGDDLGRCFRLLEKIPEWKSRLDEVADAFPSWEPLVESWSQLQALYSEDLIECQAHGTHRMPRVSEKLSMIQ